MCENNIIQTPNAVLFSIVHNERATDLAPAPQTMSEARRIAQTFFEINVKTIVEHPQFRAFEDIAYRTNGREGGYWCRGEARDEAKADFVDILSDHLINAEYIVGHQINIDAFAGVELRFIGREEYKRWCFPRPVKNIDVALARHRREVWDDEEKEMERLMSEEAHRAYIEDMERAVYFEHRNEHF